MKLKRAMSLVLALMLLAATPAMAVSNQVKQLLTVAVDQVGAPYKLASSAPESFNCVSFVAYCFNQVVPGKITRDGIDGSYQKIRSFSGIEPGDIVCFRISKRLRGVMAYHYGIYLGKGYVVHASNALGEVGVSEIKNYKKRFVGALRLL